MKPILFCLLSIPLALSACSVDSVKHTLPTEPVKATLSGNMLDTFQCVRATLKVNSTQPTLFLVDAIVDGTKESPHDGPLADSGEIQLKSSLVELIPKKSGMVSDVVPAIFHARKGGEINSFGTVAPNLWKSYLQFTSSLFEERMPRVLLIKGSFTRFDSNPNEQSDRGFSLGNDGDDGDGELSYGEANRKQGVGLTINIIDPPSSIIISTQSFLANAENGQKDLKIRIGPGEGAVGYKRSFQKSLTPHEIQQHLIDVAALWIANKAYSSANIGQCLSSEKKAAIKDIN